MLALLAKLPHPYVVLGNHDYAISRDPFSRPVELGRLEHGTMLLDNAEVVELRGKRIELAGVDPRSWLQKRASAFEDPGADLRILLCHFPRALDTVSAGRWDLILAGHLHAGQIVLPYGFGKLLLAHPGRPLPRGDLRAGGDDDARLAWPGHDVCALPVLCPPEATELVLRCTDAWKATASSRPTCSRATPPMPRPRFPASTRSSAAARVTGSEVEVHVVVDYGANIPTVAGQVQRRVADYLAQMADARPDAVHVVVDDVQR